MKKTGTLNQKLSSKNNKASFSAQTQQNSSDASQQSQFTAQPLFNSHEWAFLQPPKGIKTWKTKTEFRFL